MTKYYNTVALHGITWFWCGEEVWRWNPSNQTGLSGTDKAFDIKPGYKVTVTGPYCSNMKSLMMEWNYNPLQGYCGDTPEEG
jgi:hypothetical protein